MAEVETSTQVCVYSERAVICHKVWCYDEGRKYVCFERRRYFIKISVMA